MVERQKLLEHVAEQILELPTNHTIRVAIDGVDGSGKTFFANELAQVLESAKRPIIRSSVDSFHNPKSVRYRMGKTSPEGYFRDSYNYPQLKETLLDPLSPDGSGRYRTAVFDHKLDAQVSLPEEQAQPNSILIFDGIFLHRPELRTYWDFSIFLEVGFNITFPRMAQRGDSSPNPLAPENHRYVAGQKRYLRACTPQKYATVVINNENLATPYIVT